mgnify:CR=1 FL=1
MKKRFLPLCLSAGLAAIVWAAAAGGGADDPLASLSYLNGTFTAAVDKRVDAALDASDALLRERAENGETAGSAALWQEVRLKEGDALQGVTGTGALLLAGSAQVIYASGAVVDVTTGTTVTSGSALTASHRYLVAEETTAVFTVTSKTAVVDYQGPYAFSYSTNTDYNAIAAALKTMHLFQGSFTGYGDGYDLEVAPTRLQALIMFIRVLGEENDALAYTGSTPFTDITPGTQSEKYVGYAYSKGYTNGYSATTFRPSQTVTASQYMEFILRALGYSSADNKDLSGTLTNALTNGVITEGELAALQGGTFLRADLAYVSYYALDAAVSGSRQTLGDTLMDKGVFTVREKQAADALVTSGRK